MEDWRSVGVPGLGLCMMHQDHTDSLFECPYVVYVGIPHGHQLLCVVMAVLHNAHAGLASFKLSEKNKSQLDSDNLGGTEEFRNPAGGLYQMPSQQALPPLLYRRHR